MIVLIAAVSDNNALGKDNDLIWHLPNDFKRFKEITTGHFIIMGRKTFESFAKPLPNRTHVVITRQKDFQPEGCIVVNSLENAIAVCPKNETIFIIGGGEIYQQALVFSDKMEITRVHGNFEADTFFPEIKNDEWQLIQSEVNSKDNRHHYDYTYQTFVKK